MLQSLKVQSNLISLESGSPETVYSAVTNFFPRLITGIKDFASGIFAESNTPVFQLTDIKSIERKVIGANYVQMSPVTLPVPSGLAVPMADYVSVVADGVDILERINSEVMVPFVTWLAVLLTNPEELRTLRASVNIPALQWHDIDGVQKRFAKSFDKSAKAERPYGDLYKRNVDYVQTVRDVNALAERVARIDRAALIKQMETAVQYLERIIENTKSDPEQFKISGATLDVLSKLTYHVAKEIEFYSIIAFSLQSLTTAVEDGNDKLKRILNP